MFRTIRALVLKEWIQTFRDRRMLVIIFFVPIIQMIMFGVAVNNELRNMPTVVCDQDHSIVSRRILSSISAGGYFIPREITSSVKDAEEALYNNRARMALIIPPGFQSDLRSGKKAEIQILLDGSDSNAATLAAGYVFQILRETPSGGRVQARPPGVAPFEMPKIVTRVYYNPALESSHFMVPVIITMILTIIATMLTAMGITKEKEKGTFEQLFVSPIRGIELMLGKTIPFAVISFLDAALATTLGVFLFRIPLEGQVWVLALLNLGYVLAMLGLGLFISTVSETQQQAMMTVFAVIFPFIILSDFFFPIENMPVFFQYATLINPMRYCLRAQREIFLKGTGIEHLWPNIVVLFSFATAFLGYGALRFRKSLTI